MKLSSIVFFIAVSATFAFYAQGQPIEELLRARANGCNKGSFKIVKTPFSPIWCKTNVCVNTHDATLTQVKMPFGCGPVECTEEGDANKLTKRTGGIATSEKGGKGTCALTHLSTSTFYCSPKSKVTVEVDYVGIATFKAEGPPGQIPIVIAGSKGATGNGTSGTTKEPYSSLSIDCSGIKLM